MDPTVLMDVHRSEKRGAIGHMQLNSLQELTDLQTVQLTKRVLNNSLDIAGRNRALEVALEIDIDIESIETRESAEIYRILKANEPRAT